MSLYGYLARLEDTLRSRQDIENRNLQITLTTIGAILRVDLCFYNGSQLSVVEEVERIGHRDVRRIAYKFHYQRADGTMIFRYDNAPHYPGVPTFPHHKHVGDSVVAAEEPDLSDVLREIDRLIYGLDTTDSHIRKGGK